MVNFGKTSYIKRKPLTFHVKDLPKTMSHVARGNFSADSGVDNTLDKSVKVRNFTIFGMAAGFTYAMFAKRKIVWGILIGGFIFGSVGYITTIKSQ